MTATPPERRDLSELVRLLRMANAPVGALTANRVLQMALIRKDLESVMNIALANLADQIRRPTAICVEDACGLTSEELAAALARSEGEWIAHDAFTDLIRSEVAAWAHSLLDEVESALSEGDVAPV